MCKTTRQALSYYSPELIETAKKMLPKRFEHDVCWWDGELRLDGKRVKVITNSNEKWIQIGCAKITFEAIEVIASWCRSKDETVIQSEQLLPVDGSKINVTSTGPW